MTEIEIQARAILTALIEVPFSKCIPIARDLTSLTPNPGIYAVRHQTDGLLYIGKAQDVRERFRGGHKALTWAWIADYHYREVAIALYVMDFLQWRTLSSELERLILQITEPPFNVRIPMRE